MTILFKGEYLELCKERAIYWKEKKMLIISDLHLGKSAHFRKSGIQVPSSVGTNDLQRLGSLLNTYDTDILLITGDMFHNYMNSDVEDFKQWRADYPHLKIQLIKGNHDALQKTDYEDLSIEMQEKEWYCGPFRFMHDQPEINNESYTLSGHIHPGITLYGKARQRLNFPCFYFGKNYAILPAFSLFTGLSMLKPQEGDQFYAITPAKVIKI